MQNKPITPQPTLRFSTSNNGSVFCEYFGENKTIHGVGALGKNAEEAQINLWEMVKKIELEQLRVNPEPIEMPDHFRFMFGNIKKKREVITGVQS